MIKQGFVLAILLMILTSGSLFAQEYSLTELYKLALERSETIQIAREEIYLSEQERDKALAGLLPTLSTFGSHTRYNEEKRSSTSILQPEYSTSWGLKLDQSLSLSGREFTSHRISKRGIIKNRYDLDKVKEEYLLNVAVAYYDVIMAKKALDIASANVERLTKHRDAANTRLTVGEVTKTALLRAEAELSGAQSEVIKAENNLKSAKANLSKIVGISGDYDVKESSQSQVHSPQSLTADCRQTTIDCLKTIALSERAELKALIIEKKIAEDKITYAEGSYWPSLSLEGVYSRDEEHPSSAYAIKETTYGTIKLNFPFFEGGLRRAEVREARARLRQTEYRLSDLGKTINLEVETAYLTVLTESGILKKLEAQVEYARDNFNAVSRQFEYGLANSLDVMDANTLLVTSERELTNARFNYQLAILKLHRATGTLLKTVISQ